MEIFDTAPPTRLAIQLDFQRPFETRHTTWSRSSHAAKRRTHPVTIVAAPPTSPPYSNHTILPTLEDPGPDRVLACYRD
jgi:hypothetical protein